jgi:2-polyprenyl-3-methyl-5-hydroxy-6-metoxy-1,4-benzoquinol methylase
MSSVACPLCRSAEYVMVYDMSDIRTPNSVPGLIVRCEGCPMWFKVPNAPEAIAEAYGNSYGAEVAALDHTNSGANQELFEEVLSAVQVSSRIDRPRLLDVGSGMGSLLEVAQGMGFDAEGIDLCEPNVAHATARGLRVTHGDAEAMGFEDTFDVITMMDIVEHVLDPVHLLRVAYRALKPGGRLVVYTPNHRASVVLLARLLKRVGVTYPAEEIFGRNHVCFFDDRTLKTALENAHLSVDRISLSPYDPRRPGAEISLLNLIAVTAIERMGQPFKRVFRMLAYAQKRASAA